MSALHTVVDSPIGPLTLVATDGALIGLYMREHRHGPADDGIGPRCPREFGQAREQLGEYFAGERTVFDLPTEPGGTPFQRRVWEALRTVPYGSTRSYGELAAAIGRPRAARAVGLANGRNPLSIIVPCHRLVGADGSLTGYGGGLQRKRYLLELERGRGPNEIGAPAASR